MYETTLSACTLSTCAGNSDGSTSGGGSLDVLQEEKNILSGLSKLRPSLPLWLHLDRTNSRSPSRFAPYDCRLSRTSATAYTLLHRDYLPDPESEAGAYHVQVGRRQRQAKPALFAYGRRLIVQDRDARSSWPQSGPTFFAGGFAATTTPQSGHTYAQFSVGSLFAAVAVLFGATQVAAIAADPYMACGCPNNCNYNVGDSCKWKESVAFDEVVVSGHCILDGYGRKICSK
ncbi:hypothetical protein EV122DRAFT_293868 [Schizophyllum commune]